MIEPYANFGKYIDDLCAGIPKRELMAKYGKRDFDLLEFLKGEVKDLAYENEQLRHDNKMLTDMLEELRT